MFLGERKKDRESEDCEREEHIQVAGKKNKNRPLGKTQLKAKLIRLQNL